MNFLFVFTAGVVIINMVLIFGYMVKAKFSFPKYGWLSPSNWIIFYPSFFYQVYWWAAYFNLLS